MQEVDRFLASETARRLGIYSRNDFFKKTTICVLAHYRKSYQELERLFMIEDAELKAATVADLD